jgi:glycine/D-amino acid oxidase-like deaminating enzyme
MRIAVIGAGFTGLAITWHLLNTFLGCEVQLIDYRVIGGGTSGMAAGLLHPFIGAHAKLNHQGHEGMAATRELLTVASQAIDRSVIASQTGLPRLALSLDQQINFKKNAVLYATENRWLTAQECQLLIPSCADAPGLWISSALTVYAQNYLEGLWRACQQLGAQFEQRKIQNLKELDDFDLVILTTGAEVGCLKELSHLPVTRVKGQILELSPPNPLLTHSINSQAYALMTETGKSCLVGASYERDYQTIGVDLEAAKREILPKAFALYPPLQESQIIQCWAGSRASAPFHLPLIQQISSRVWVLTGMGSKGLLYHALYAKELITRIKIS